MISRTEWESTHQHFEADWWGDCANTYGEETKQLAYAKVMGLDPGPWQAGNPWPVYDMGGRTVLDVGGGPVSMLLKCKNLAPSWVLDPCEYPTWTLERYAAHGIHYARMPAEDYFTTEQGGFLGRSAGMPERFDEALCYNVLQHTIDPEAIIRGMRSVAKVIRVFEWIETDSYLGHPHTLHADQLAEWCGGEGRTVVLDEVYQELQPDAELGPEMAWRVEQQAWGGAFGG